MNIHHRFRGCAYILVILSYCALAVTESEPLIFFLGALAAALSWFLVERPNRAMPRWLINIGVLLAALLLFWELVLLPDFNLLSALAHFMAAVLACKLFERKTNRDFSQILTLSLLIMVTSAILTSSLLFGILMVCYFALGLYIILLFHLRTEFTAQSPAPLPASSDPRIRRDIRFITAAAAVVLLLFASLIFILFPRNKGREFLAKLAVNRAVGVTGFNDTVIFTDFGRLHQSYAIVMEATIVEKNGNDELNLGSTSGDYYFRGATFDLYEIDHRKWVHSQPAPGLLEASSYAVSDGDDAFTLQSPQAPDADITNYFEPKWLMTQKITLFPAAGDVLFTVAPAVGIHDMHDIRKILRNPRDGNLTYSGPAADHISYQIDSPQIYQAGVFQLPTDFKLPDQPISDIIRQYALIAAGDLAPAPGDTPDPQQSYKIAQRIESYLRDHYAYSLEIHTIDGTLDPVSDFLKNRQKVGAHCQYFASAMVLMCRALNIPARLVTGYHGGDFNSFDNVYTIRQKDAHAWVEVLAARPEWKSTLGWITFDPTPAADSTPVAVDSWHHWLNQLFEVAQRGWLASIVSFDNNSRQYLVDAIIQPLTQSIASLELSAHAFALWIALRTFSPYATFFSCLNIALPASILLASAAWFALRWRRWRNSALRPTLHTIKTRAHRKQLLQELSFFDDLITLLKRKGERRSPSQTPREFVQAACQSVAIADEDALWIVDRFYELRFGSSSPSPQLRTDIATRISRLRIALKHA